jgi:hypothetical protein
MLKSSVKGIRFLLITKKGEPMIYTNNPTFLKALLTFILFTTLFACTPKYTQQQVSESQAIKSGPGFFLFRDKTIPENSAMRVFYYKPSGFNADSPIFFILHGYGRQAEELMYVSAISAETFNFLLIVPEYSFRLFPTWEEYNYGNARKKPKELWTYFVNDRVFHFVKKETKSRQDKYYLFGHSAGSQFVHRQLMVGASNFVEKAFAANAGEYAMPTFGEVSFPWSMSGLDLSKEDLKRLFSFDLYVLLGEGDVIQDEYFARGDVFDQQGSSRLERGKNFYKIGKDKAGKLGLDFNWKLVTVPHVGHSALGMLPVALRLAFSKSK